MQKRKVEYTGKDGKITWFWTTEATAWAVPFDGGPEYERLYRVKNSDFVLESDRGEWVNEYGEDVDTYAVRLVGKDEAYRWLQKHRKIGPGEKYPSELRHLAEGNRAKRPRTPPREVKRRIEEYLAKHAEEFEEFKRLAEDGEIDEPLFRSVFGRNVVCKACGLTGDTVSRFQQWREVAEALRLIA
jgi:hypothetical protein